MAVNSLLPGQKTLAQLRLQARQYADQAIKGAPLVSYPDYYGDSFVTSAELDGYLNNYYNELFGLLVVTYGNYYTIAYYNFVTDGVNELFPLPADMLKLQGVDWVQSPGSNLNNVTLKNFMMGERNQFAYPYYAVGTTYPGACLYQLSGKSLWMKPVPAGGSTYQVIYVPLPVLLADSGTIAVSGAVVGTALTINPTPVPASALTLTAIAFGGSPTASQFVLGGTGVANMGDVGTAASLAAQINASAFGGPSAYFQATADGASVGIVLLAPATVTWSASDAHLILDPSVGSGPLGTTLQWTNVMSGFAGWWEYLTLGAAIDMIIKEESDPSAFAVKFEKLKMRIKTECDNRDQGSSARVTDVYRRGGRVLYGVGGGGGGRFGDD